MNEGLIASRYAGALLQYAIEHHADTDLYHMMKQVADCYLNVPDLGRTFGNWTLDTEKRKALFLDLFPGYNPQSLDVLSNFLDLLIRQRRENAMHSVSLQYADKYRDRHGIIYGVFTTTLPPDDGLLEKIRNLLNPGNPEKVELEWKEDPDLIGGFTLTLGMNEWDASLRTRLREVGKSYGLKEFY
ncbi:MAG: ATP synthase F1 subunit delta [Bacteroidales bacterium]|jgi:F-type H+-transporting ATPase subunit delta|nr:ATP synthase F1 subunit delta [Bacteroidales bacterium]HKM31045.1 ATP synthase F1 subunit delta [Bacteroidales bacterium]